MKIRKRHEEVTSKRSSRRFAHVFRLEKIKCISPLVLDKFLIVCSEHKHKMSVLARK